MLLEECFESALHNLKGFKAIPLGYEKMKDKRIFSTRDVTMHASLLRPAFVVSTTQKFVFRTQNCDFYGGTMVGKNNGT